MFVPWQNYVRTCISDFYSKISEQGTGDQKTPENSSNICVLKCQRRVLSTILRQCVLQLLLNVYYYL